MQSITSLRLSSTLDNLHKKISSLEGTFDNFEYNDEMIYWVAQSEEFFQKMLSKSKNRGHSFTSNSNVKKQFLRYYLLSLMFEYDGEKNKDKLKILLLKSYVIRSFKTEFENEIKLVLNLILGDGDYLDLFCGEIDHTISKEDVLYFRNVNEKFETAFLYYIQNLKRCAGKNRSLLSQEIPIIFAPEPVDMSKILLEIL